MAIPSWTYPSNYNLGTISERRQADIPVLVFDTEDRSTLETSNFENTVDSTLLPNYSDDYFFWIKSNGLAQTPWIGEPDGYFKYTPVAQNYVFKFPRDKINIYGESVTVSERAETNTPVTDFFGVAINGVPFKSPNSGKKVTYKDRTYTENSYIYPLQDFFIDGSGLIGPDKRFYYQSDPKLIYTKNSNQHSPIIGYAFDGNPIYGPYGYINPTNTNSGVKIMRTSYRLTDDQRANETLPDGTFIEDFIYVNGLGDLDECNGRFCKTPEYPDGTYAYFVTVDPDDVNLPRYPYIVGPKYKNEPLLPNGNFGFPGEINLEVISGRIPSGMRIEGLNIVGVPFEVTSNKTFRFVLRATNLDGLSDRTYSITVEGADLPIWETPAGDLEVGAQGSRTDVKTKLLARVADPGDQTIKMNSVFNLIKQSVLTCKAFPNSIASDTRIVNFDKVNKIISLNKPLIGPITLGTEITFTYTYEHTNLFVLDNQYVDYQLSAIDNDTAAGQVLKYYIPPRGGTLPPGLELTEEGRIFGFTEAILANEQYDNNGNYDMQLYDKFAYDYGVRPYNGYDSFLFDTTIFDFSDLTRSPRKINRYYQFIVRVSDGVFYTDRKFRIFVIGDDYFRADTTILEVGNSTYTTDVTPLRKPFWLTPSYLGRRRANNYITTYLDVYESNTLRGTIGYVLDPINDDGSISLLPPGMQLDQITGEIYGDVPYQPAVTKTYKFTIRAIRYDPDNPLYGYARNTTGINNIGSNTLKLDSVTNLRIDSLVTAPLGTNYIVPGTIITAINLSNKTVTINTPLLNSVPEGVRFVFSYLVSAAKTFTLDIIGEVDSTIKFITPGQLTDIPANYVSDLQVEAITTVSNAVLNYTLIGGRLPPGLTLVSDGTIQGKVNQYASDETPGLTTFDGNETSFDSFDTTVDRDYTFIVLAQDQFNFSAVTKIFKLHVTTPNKLLYSNIYVKPFLKNSKRLDLVEFFTNPDIFELDKIYRPSDPEFGVQNQLKMLVYAGIETRDASEYAAALGRSSKKRYRFGNLRKAVAKTPGTNNVVYEAVYIEVIDNMENDLGSVSKEISTRYLTGITMRTKSTARSSIAGTFEIYLNSIEDISKGDTVFNPDDVPYLPVHTSITHIDRINKIITLDSPIRYNIPVGTVFNFDQGNFKINQSKRDLWDSSITDNNIILSSEDVLSRIWMQDKIVTADFVGQRVSDQNKSNIFGNSTTNIRDNIKSLGETERNFLPLWMRTPQTFSGIAQNFTKSIVLAYVIPGHGDRIINNIKNLGIDFKTIDFTVDRVIIDSVKGEVGDKYIAFGAREIING